MGLIKYGISGALLVVVPLLWEPSFHEGFFYRNEVQKSPYGDHDFKNLGHTAEELPKAVSKKDLDQFHEDGYVVLKGFLDEALVSEMTAAAEHARDNPSTYFKYFRYAFREMLLTMRSDFWRDVTAFSPISRIAKAFLHPGTENVYRIADGLWAKVPGVAAPVNQGDDKNWTLPFHRDRPELPIDTQNCVNLWLALKPIAENDSPLLVIPTSHDMPNQEVKHLLKDPSEAAGKFKSTSPMQPGDIIAMNCSTLHGSDALGMGSDGRLAYVWFFAGDTDKDPVHFTKEVIRFGKYCQYQFWNGIENEKTKFADTECYSRLLPSRLGHQNKARDQESCGPNVWRLPMYAYGFIRNIYLYVNNAHYDIV